MKKIILKTALLACVAMAGNAQAVGNVGQGTWETRLLGRDVNGAAVTARDGDGVLDDSAVFLYDTLLDVTWLRNANANGEMTWDEASSWAANLTKGTYSDWRLPTVSNPIVGYPGDVTNNEMASLWYGALGNTQGSFSNMGDFLGFTRTTSYAYWSGLEYASDTGDAWYFSTKNGLQNHFPKDSFFYALAVHPSGVAAPIPEPETYALMLAGLAVVGAAARRRKAK